MDSDPSTSVETRSHTKDSTEAPVWAVEGVTSQSKEYDHLSAEELDKKSTAQQLLQLMETFGEIGGDVVSSVFDSCQHDIEKAVTKLSEMTESMGIERYVVLKPGDEGSTWFDLMKILTYNNVSIFPRP